MHESDSRTTTLRYGSASSTNSQNARMMQVELYVILHEAPRGAEGLCSFHVDTPCDS